MIIEMKFDKFNALTIFFTAIFSIYIIISIFYLFTALGFGSVILEQLFSTRVLLALWVSVSSSLIVVGISLLFGIPAAWLLANRDFKGNSVLEAILVLIPVSYPPGVVGMSYLLIFSPSSPIGAFFTQLGMNPANTFWALIIVKTFISSPFLTSMLTRKFRDLKKTNIEMIARSLGASNFKVFYKVSLPMSYKVIASGSALTWARAMGEIAGTIVFAGAIEPGVTETIPAIIVFESQVSLPIALTVSMILATFSILILVIFKVLLQRGEE